MRTFGSQSSNGEITGSMDLSYARQFQVDYYADGCALITIGEEKPFLLVPEHLDVPAWADDTVTILHQPLHSIYLASSSAMDLFLALDALDLVSMTSTSAENWSIDEIRKMVRDDEITYVGKYSSPDYETLLDAECSLAVENTMIYHEPAVKEQLERLGIPVIVERSSYESHPLGRLEWIRLYGLLAGKQEEADLFFEDCVNKVQSIPLAKTQNPGCAFFYITTSGSINVRSPGDYIAKMIQLAGGTYLFPEGDTVQSGTNSSVSIQMESFYAAARDADILIYNGTVNGSPQSLDDLLKSSPLFADFKAVQTGNVWCTNQNMFQQVSGTAEMIVDLYHIFSGSGKPLRYLKPLL